ncbi:MAG: hypothetical protein DSY89_00795 [Deltaproteobacteria bacterium]|nr:MAG: hypothetical protein DSY89_00795 [Deltaproteobacteria bacterium]
MINDQIELRTRLGLGLVTLSILLLELCLVRTLDVILNPVMGYMVITTAMFALGLGGIYVFIFKDKLASPRRFLPLISVISAASVLCILPVFNLLPFSLHLGKVSLVVNVISWLAMYLFLSIPFFISGIIISILFATYSSESHSLYFFDLSGAGLGCLLVVFFIPYYGPGGFLFLIAGLMILAGLLFSSLDKVKRIVALPIIIVMMVYPLFVSHYLEFRGHGNKRGVDQWMKMGLRDYVKWDPVSKLEVFNVYQTAKNFSLDGGQQGSWMRRFDRSFDEYHEMMRRMPDKYFYGIGSVAHYFSQSKKANVLEIGAAVGSEIKAALVFNARHVDAIDLVGAMVDAAKNRYADFSGGVFRHPKVNYVVGEGRTFLRASKKKYDIIQMFSNHTSSSLANGAGVLSPVYLQTAEAYMEYFEHLTDDGILQINHHIYPKMIISAAKGWYKLGRKDFASHVLVVEKWSPNNLPTLLIKMTPWKQGEVDKVIQYMNRKKTGRVEGVPHADSPSKKIYAGKAFRSSFVSRVDDIEGITIRIATYNQDHLDAPVTIRIYSQAGDLLRTGVVDGKQVKDNGLVDFTFDPLHHCRNRRFEIEVASDEKDLEKGFSVWLTRLNQPVMQTIPKPPLPAYHIAFHPLRLKQNLIPAQFLSPHFPEDLASKADYIMDPATDDKPFFNMIRKKNRLLETGTSEFLDGGTAYFLNNRYQPLIPYDWISIVVVGAISLLFSLVFIFVPLLTTKTGRAKWKDKKNKGLFLAYFSCLGAGFIIVELVFIQVFIKLIGYPTYTFATVIFALLFSAGIGSIASKKWRLQEESRWKIIFVSILLIGFFLILTYGTIFSWFLGAALPVRLIVAFLMILPLGFFMGMPFPLGMVQLGKTEPGGIPWAWGMNGFFTVFGGYLSLVCSFWIGFKNTLSGGLLIYLLAFMLFWAIKANQKRSPARG